MVDSDLEPEPNAPAQRRDRLILGLVLALACISAWWVWRRDMVVFDDAYISFRYAQNLVAGHGLVFNPGERVEGYSNFLWVLLAALALRLGLDPLAATRFVGLGAHFAVLAVAGAFLLHVARRLRPRDLALLGLAVALVAPHGLLAVAGCGLETSAAGLALLLVGYFHHVSPPARPSTRLLASLAPLAAVLLRLDSLLAVAVSAGVLFAERSSADRRPARALAFVLARFAPTALGLAAWIAWKLRYYGELLPNTYWAKAADQLSFGPGARYLLAYLIDSPQVLALLPAAAAALFLAWRTRHRWFALWAAGTLLLHVAYVAKVGGDFMYYRFMFELYPTFVCLAGLGIVLLLRSRALAFGLATPLLAAGLSFTPPHLEKTYGMQSLEEMDRYARLGRRVGERLAELLPPGTLVSTTLIGTIGYYSRLPIVDQWGLVDPVTARKPGRDLTYRGHAKPALKPYLRERGVRLCLDHPTVTDCRRAAPGPFPGVYVRMSPGECLRTWYLTEDPQLEAHFRAHPEDFVLLEAGEVAPPPGSRPRR
jgi:arabinofuranosyltransferase